MQLCRHYGECGGCSTQEVEYGDQLASKMQRIRDLFPGQEVSSIVPCLDPWRYRNKMEFSFSQDKKGNQYLGLMIRKGRGRVVNLHECHLTSTWFMDAVARVRAWWKAGELNAYFPPKNVGNLRTLTLREGITTGEKLAMLTVAPGTDAAGFGNPVATYPIRENPVASALPERSLFANSTQLLASSRSSMLHPKPLGSHKQSRWQSGFADLFPEATTIVRTQHTKKGTPTWFEESVLTGSGVIHEELHGVRFRIGPSAFFQPNTRQAERLYSLVLEMMGPARLVYDLYCGTGTLGILAAARAERVVGVELNSQACADARVNIELNGLTNVEIIEGDVGKIELEPGPDAVLVDPPRMGLSPEALALLLSLKAGKIVYISCNPVTQAANVASLVESGYAIQAIQPVDQFPHTPHIENIVSLKTRVATYPYA